MSNTNIEVMEQLLKDLAAKAKAKNAAPVAAETAE